MTEPRLKTGIWIQALMWRCSQAGVPATVVRRGDGDAGAVIVKLNRRNGVFTLLVQTRTSAGELAWSKAGGSDTVDEAAADSYIARQIGRDPDLWVVEIEDREGERFLDRKVI